jgi:transcriptional regulator GlxA family with amidase domain
MKNYRIVFLVLPETHLLDLAGPMQVFQEAEEQGCAISMTYCSFIEGELNTSSHFPIGNLQPFAKVEPDSNDFVLVPGANVGYLLSLKTKKDDPVKTWLRKAYEKGAHVGSICTGAFFLAYAGLLNGRKCTTHWKRTAELKQHFPKINLVENVLFIDDNRILTSAGVAAGIDLALHIVSKLAGEHIAFKVARELVIYIRRNASETQQSVFTQYRNHINSGIHRVQDYVQDNLDKATSIPNLSEIACMSTRNLTRTFKRETGVTINNYLSLIRKERLFALMGNTDYTRKQMARQLGLKSERQVIRLIKQIAV